MLLVLALRKQRPAGANPWEWTLDHLYVSPWRAMAADLSGSARSSRRLRYVGWGCSGGAFAAQALLGSVVACLHA